MKLETDEKIINHIRRKISEAENVVAVLGIEMMVEGGGYDLDSNENTYRVEETYGYAPEDMLSTSFFNAKAAKFYRFYRDEILAMEVSKTPAYDALMRLQEKGKLHAVINQNYHGIPEGVHLNNVIELNGSIHSNWCRRCNRYYDLAYMRNASDIPRCEGCGMALRPQIRLIGERVNMGTWARAANACREADVLLIMGKDMYYDRMEINVDPARHTFVVLFSQEKNLPDRQVDVVIHDEIQAVMPEIVKD